MALLFHPGGDRDHCFNEYALPDYHFSFQFYGTHWRSVDRDWSYPEHEHPLLEINIVLEGCQLTVVDGVEYRMEAWDLMVIPPGYKHASRVESSEGMTYFCVHLDIDDRSFLQQLVQLPQLLYDRNSETAQQMKLQLVPLIEATRLPASMQAEERVRVRSSVLQLLILLGELIASTSRTIPSGDDFIERKTIKEIQRLREQNLLEKKVQDLFYEQPDPEMPLDESMFPKYRWIALFSFTNADEQFWNKPDRYWIKTLLEDTISRSDTVVVILEDRQMTAVVFSNQIAVPEVEENMLEAKRKLEEKFGIEIVAGFGGITTDLTEVRRMYLLSLRMHDAPTEQSVMVSKMVEFIHRIIRRAMSYLQAEYMNREISLSMLADMLDISPNYLSTLFTSETGFTFTHHLTRIRMEQAKRLLVTTNMKIYQICQNVGYMDQAYFSRLFKSLEGMSPYQYRIRSKLNNS